MSSSSLPDDYVQRVYAGVLGKLIGVYLGRPFEGWTHQRILKELGPVRYYVNEKLGMPLVVTDDDISGTFGFVRALQEHGSTSDLSSESVGKTWLNNVIDHRSVFWWGGKGISTEHTAYINLKNGIPAPRSGAIETNGETVAEQIGAQIFIDGWAMVAPGRPALAAKLAEAAGSVSHDGNSVHAAKLWAAMEAEAFISKDVDHLLDTGLRFIPSDSGIASLVKVVRDWVKQDGDNWSQTRLRIEAVYGYDKFHGCCHVIPNHAIMIMTLLYAGHSFDKAMHIINTCGWDTDCNSGNVACLVALMHGLSAFDGLDWRGPLADRALISTADGGYSINNAARIALDVANLGSMLALESPILPPKHGAQFHFTLPGSVQGFQVQAPDTGAAALPADVKVEQGVDEDNRPGLAIRLTNLTDAKGPVEVTTPTFISKDVDNMGPVYPLMASPLVYPGQRVEIAVRACNKSGFGSVGSISCRLRLKAYGRNDDLVTLDGPVAELVPNCRLRLEWTIPDDMDSQPIQQLGIAVAAESGKPFDGTVWLDYLQWSGMPHMLLRRPIAKPCTFWNRAWVNGADDFHVDMTSSFCVTKNSGEGIVSIGTREWIDYRTHVSNFKVAFGSWAGVAVNVRGLNRYYALVLRKDKTGGNSLAIVKAFDEQREELASANFDWELDASYGATVVARGNTIKGIIGETVVEAGDEENGWRGGGMGFVVADGSLFADTVEVSPV